MVKPILFAAWLASSAAGAASLRAAVEPSTVALGEPLSLTLTATGVSLDRLDITPLTRQFDVSSRTLSRGTNSETLVLTLYPRAVGSIVIPSLQLENSRTPELKLTIQDGSETVPQVSAHWVLTPAKPWVNQPVRLRLSICDDDSLQWSRPPLPGANGRLLRALGGTTDEGMRGTEKCTLHQYDWSLIATQSGSFALDAPMLTATRFGQRLRFPAPTLTYQVQPLPAWLPDHVPPVKPQIVQDALPQTWPQNRPLSWRFRVTGGYSVDGLKAVLDLQLHDTAAFRFYPPTITRAAVDDTTSPLTHFDVTVYAQPHQRGALQLPTVRLPWYDTAHGRMGDVALRADRVIIDDPRWTLVGWVASGVAGAILLAAAFWQVRRMVCWRRARRRGLKRIAEAQSIETLARAVRQFSLSDTPAAASLGDWMRQLQRDARGCEVGAVVAQLEQQQFGHAAPNLADVRLAFVTALKRVRPLSLKSCGHSNRRKRQA